MTLEAAFVAKLGARAELVALIAARIYPDRLPQGVAYPAVSYRMISNERVSAFGSDTGLAQPRYQFDSWAERKLDAINTSAEVRKALQRWRQDGPPEIQGTFILSEIDIDDGPEAIFRRSLDVRFIWREGT